MVITLSGSLLILESLRVPYWDHYYLYYILMILGMLLIIHPSKFLLMTFQVSCYDYCLKLQNDLLCVYQWSLKWA